MARTLVLAGKIGPMFGGAEIIVPAPYENRIKTYSRYTGWALDLMLGRAFQYSYLDMVAFHVEKESGMSPDFIKDREMMDRG